MGWGLEASLGISLLIGCLLSAVRSNDPSQRRVLDSATRQRRLNRQLEALEKDNFQDDPHANLPQLKRLPQFDDDHETGECPGGNDTLLFLLPSSFSFSSVFIFWSLEGMTLFASSFISILCVSLSCAHWSEWHPVPPSFIFIFYYWRE